MMPFTPIQSDRRRAVVLLAFISALPFLIQVPKTFAQDSPKPAPKLPANPGQWVNSPPITNEMLVGKAAVLYFFEEECPKCVEAWPRVLSATTKFEGQPVMFIAVNSGTARPQLENYLRRNKVTWPVICDSDRSFESQFPFKISLQNIKQVYLILPNGSLKTGEFDNLEGSAVDGLREAKWRVDPKDLPQQLKAAWQAIEFGKYSDAAPLLKKHLNGKGAIKDSAQMLNQFVLDDLTAQLEAAKKTLDDDKKWSAFKKYSAIPVKFKGFAVPSDVATTLKELSGDDAVKEELAAFKTLELAKQSAAKSPTARKGAIKQLQTLIKDHGNTEAAQEAEEILKQAEMP
ncbi:MAG: redoxin domain-containing protein [Planctomycetia bacterium]|nr:redoxin domain-containing protein [Planctomycetia bacterium]